MTSQDITLQQPPKLKLEPLTDILDADTVALVVFFLTHFLLRVLIPPPLLECLKFTLVQEFEDAASIRNIL